MVFVASLFAFGIGIVLLTRELTNWSVGTLKLANEHTKTKHKSLQIFREFTKFIRLDSANKRFVFI